MKYFLGAVLAGMAEPTYCACTFIEEHTQTAPPPHTFGFISVEHTAILFDIVDCGVAALLSTQKLCAGFSGASAVGHARPFHAIAAVHGHSALLRPALVGCCLIQHSPAQSGQPSRSSWQQYRSFRAQFPAVLGQEGKRSPCDPVLPSDCDRIVEELRYRDIRVPRQLNISWRRRIEGALFGVYKACKATVMFFIRIPSYLNSARRMSVSEWRQALSSTWATVKHEAHHYWVCLSTIYIQITISARTFMAQSSINTALYSVETQCLTQ